MLTVGAFFGGDSSEHDISVITALEAIAAMPSAGIKCVPVYMRDGKWYTGAALTDVKSYMPFCGEKHTEVHISGKTLYYKKRGSVRKKYAELDCALILAHGGMGEGGGLQGLLEIYGIPYTSAGVTASAMCMDKYLTKKYLGSCGVPVLDGVRIPRGYVKKDLEDAEKLGYPLFVKPNSQGSSIGAGMARDRAELEERLALAHEFDEYALIERCIPDASEYNVAIFSASGTVHISEPEKPSRVSEFLTFDDKYMRGRSGMSGAEREFPAKVTEKTREELKRLSGYVYKIAGLDGVVRIDYISDGKKLYLNEINTVPGSMAHYLFPEYNYTEFLRMLIENALYKGLNAEKVYYTDVLNRGKGKGS